MESGSSKAAAKPPPQLQPAIKETKKNINNNHSPPKPRTDAELMRMLEFPDDKVTSDEEDNDFIPKTPPRLVDNLVTVIPETQPHLQDPDKVHFQRD